MRIASLLVRLVAAAVLVVALTGAAGCPRREPAGHDRTEEERPTSPSIRRLSSQAHRSLLREAHRAELWSDGLFIRLASPDQHKFYSLRDRGRWSLLRASGPRAVEVHGWVRLDFRDWWGEARQIVVMARAGPGSRDLSAVLDGKLVGSEPLSTDWRVIRFRLGAQLRPGPRSLMLEIGPAPSAGRLAQIQWIWLATGGPPPPDPVRVGVASFGSPRRALLAGRARTYSFYLTVPRRAALVFDHAARAPTRFEVAVEKDGRPRARLFSGMAAPRWREARVNLSAYAGDLVRLDLVAAAASPEQSLGAAWGEPTIVAPRQTPARAGALRTSARNLIHVLVDAARQDAFRLFNPSAPVRAPALEAMARDGVTFTRAYVNAPWTPFSVPSIMTGSYHFNWLTRENMRVPKDVVLLFEHLNRHGFDTAGFIANDLTAETIGRRPGWTHLRPYVSANRDSDARQVFSDAVGWLRGRKDRGRRFYMYIHTMEPHLPFVHRGDWTTRYLDRPYQGKIGSAYVWQQSQPSAEDLRYIRALYHGEIAYHDAQLGWFLEKLRGLGVLDSTMIVFSNDHGEEIFERGEVGHGHSMYEELLRSPLVIRLPGPHLRGRRIDDIVELVDIAPTALEVLGVPTLPGMHGESLLRLASGDSARIEERYLIAASPGQAVRVGSYKHVQTEETRTLFNLDVDPGERINLVRSHPIALRACEIYLREGFHVPDKRQRLDTVMTQGPRFGSPSGILDPSLRQQLKALGYIR